MGSFGEYLAGLGGQQQSAGTAASVPKLTWVPSGSEGLGYYYDTAGNPVFDKNILNAYFSGTAIESGGVAKQPASLPSQIQSGFDKAAGIVTRGSAGAGSLLTQAYREALGARLSGSAGKLAARERVLGSQMASQGLSSDVASRAVYQPRPEQLDEAAGIRGDIASQQGADEAQLLKGTAGELAGLQTEQLGDLVNLQIGQTAASATKKAGALGAFGSALGGLAGGLVALSDRRAKENVKKVGEVKDPDGDEIPVVRFNYKGDPDENRFTGVMAQDVEHLPGVVDDDPLSGMKLVNYSRLNEFTPALARYIARSEAVNKRGRRG